MIYKYRFIDLNIDNGTTNPDTTKKTTYLNKEFTLDKDIQKILGIAVFLNQGNAIARASMRLEINGKLIFPEDYRLFMLYNNDMVSAKDRYIWLNDKEGIEAGNGKIKIDYKDEFNPFVPFPSHTAGHFYQYQVKITLLCL